MKSSYTIREKLPQDQPALEAMYRGRYPHPQLLPKITLVALRKDSNEVMGSICADFFDNDLYVFLASKSGHYSPFMVMRLINALEEILKKAGAWGYFFALHRYSDPGWINLAYEFVGNAPVYQMDSYIIFTRKLK